MSRSDISADNQNALQKAWASWRKTAKGKTFLKEFPKADIVPDMTLMVLQGQDWGEAAHFHSSLYREHREDESWFSEDVYRNHPAGLNDEAAALLSQEEATAANYEDFTVSTYGKGEDAVLVGLEYKRSGKGWSRFGVPVVIEKCLAADTKNKKVMAQAFTSYFTEDLTLSQAAKKHGVKRKEMEAALPSLLLAIKQYYIDKETVIKAH